MIVYIVDDDLSVREALKMLMLSAGMEVEIFEHAADFLESELRDKDACLISDIKMQGLGGLELQQQLAERSIKIPVIFITAYDSDEIRKKRE